MQNACVKCYKRVHSAGAKNIKLEDGETRAKKGESRIVRHSIPVPCVFRASSKLEKTRN
jgi:hypothetical protein